MTETFRAAGGLPLEDFFEHRPIEDENLVPAVDPRRDNTETQMRTALRALRTPKDGFVYEGVVINVYPSNTAAFVKRGQALNMKATTRNLMNPQSNFKLPVDTEPSINVYKVFMRGDAKPFPCGPNDPILYTYPEILAHESLRDKEPFSVGTIVELDDKKQSTIVNFYPGAVPIQWKDKSKSGKDVLWKNPTAGNPPAILGDCDNGGGSSSGTSLRFTFEEVKTLRPSLQGLMEYIAGHESRGNYNAVNRGVGGDTPGGSAALPGVGKNLTDMTIIELQSYMRNGSKAQQTGKGGNNRYGFLATGKYQLIPVTLKVAVEYFPEINTSTVKYDIETQEVLGLSLALMKRPKLGRYLLGIDSDECAAGQEAALEWASLPLQTGRPNGCQRGFSAYCVGGENSTGRLSRRPEEVIAQLRDARQRVMASTTSKQLIVSKGYQLDTSTA